MKNFLKPAVLLCCILLLAGVFRLYNINWDQNQHLHPDERFLTMVGNAMQLPPTFFSYLDPQISLFNPANNNQRFFVYGMFPLIVNKIIALLLHTDTYTDFTLQGRVLSGISDLFVVFLVFLIASLLRKKEHLHPSVPYFASFFYAISVLPIQLSHFFTVDTFLNLFLVTTFYFLLRFYYNRKHWEVILAAVLFGLAVACKISAVYLLPLFLLFLVLPYFLKTDGKLHAKTYIFSHLHSLLFVMITFFIVTYSITRLANPYLFETANFLNPTINSNFIASIKELKSWEGIDIWFPPAVQWMTKPPIIYSLSNLFFYSLGIVQSVAIVIGIYVLVRHQRKPLLFMLLSFFLLFFIYQSVQFSKPMRYFLPLFPFLAIMGGIGAEFISRRFHKAIGAVFIILLLIYPLAYFSIYLHKNTRVAASEWIYKNLPQSDRILTEHWDDPLPFLLEENYGKRFVIDQLPVFDPDTPEKWDKMRQLLNDNDYLILSSNRGWGSIPTVPQKYPTMTSFYQNLLANRLSYKKVQEFTNYPSLKYLGIPITFPDDNADESFTVYDHPKVIIFKHEQ